MKKKYFTPETECMRVQPVRTFMIGNSDDEREFGVGDDPNPDDDDFGAKRRGGDFGDLW